MNEKQKPDVPVEQRPRITERWTGSEMRKLTPDEESIVQMLRNSGKEPTQQQVNHAISQAEAIGDL